MPRRGPPAAEIPHGTALHRVHLASYGARFYGLKDASWRWDDPNRAYGVLYLGQQQAGPFVETLLRRPSQRAVQWNAVERRRFAKFEALEPIQLADLHGPGLAWFGITIADIAAEHDGASNPRAYEVTQSISARVHAETSLDGIRYRSRLDTDELCIALFERADSKIGLIEEDWPIERNWVERVIEPRGCHIIDL